jgi:repressor LexA
MDLCDLLTEKQKAVYEFIRDKIRNRGYGPTVREIGQHFEIRSPNGVMCHLKALERKRLISREPNMSRAIRLTAEPLRDSGLPLVGRIAAGVLHEAVQQDERIDFSTIFANQDQDLVALKVVGDSMIEDHIADGDYVVVRRQKTAHKGQIVVALTDENEATLKRWYPEKNRIRLEPANAAMKPIFVRDAQVWGVVEGVVRKVD